LRKAERKYENGYHWRKCFRRKHENGYYWNVMLQVKYEK
jgi:hypothetical protein